MAFMMSGHGKTGTFELTGIGYKAVFVPLRERLKGKVDQVLDHDIPAFREGARTPAIWRNGRQRHLMSSLWRMFPFA